MQPRTAAGFFFKIRIVGGRKICDLISAIPAHFNAFSLKMIIVVSKIPFLIEILVWPESLFILDTQKKSLFLGQIPRKVLADDNNLLVPILK